MYAFITIPLDSLTKQRKACTIEMNLHVIYATLSTKTSAYCFEIVLM